MTLTDGGFPQGEPISSLTQSDRQLRITKNILAGEPLATLLNLVTCERDEPPRYSTDSFITKVGQVVVTFQNEDLSKAKSVYNARLGRRVLKFHYTVDPKFYPDMNLLEFEATAYGKQAGHATFDFEGD
jgi:hypothetical protein